MAERVLTLGSVELTADAEWCDTTDEVDVADPPFTLTRVDGCGALQFTLGIYQSGRMPDPSPTTLLSMARDFGVARELTDPSSEVAESAGHLNVGAVSYRWSDDFVRVWYISDGWNFAVATYTCGLGEESLELAGCERIVRTLRFVAGRPTRA
jgi:hypothetical protein